MDETDYWTIREFLRRTFVLNGRREVNWHVARLDYWRWHCIDNCSTCGPIEEVTFIWETADGEIAAVLNPESEGEAWAHLHPSFATPSLEEDMLDVAEERLAKVDQEGRRRLRAWGMGEGGFSPDLLRARGYHEGPGSEVHRSRSLDGPIPEREVPAGFSIRSLGGHEELPARTWASWRGFHPDEPDDKYEGWEWYLNIQRMPLYRRDLDIMAVSDDGTIASITTVWYDDATRSGYFEPVATPPEFGRRGLASAVILEGMRRLKDLGADLALVGTGEGIGANDLYGSLGFDVYLRSEAWYKDLP
jgi:ribosomal protein S18 acetylase RimI-like enzyme